MGITENAARDPVARPYVQVRRHSRPVAGSCQLPDDRAPRCKADFCHSPSLPPVPLWAAGSPEPARCNPRWTHRESAAAEPIPGIEITRPGLTAAGITPGAIH